jgi:hypothetical protein
MKEKKEMKEKKNYEGEKRTRLPSHSVQPANGN